MEERIHPIKNPEVLPFHPMPVKVMDVLMAPLRFYFDPVYIHVEEVDPTRPALFVSNHTITGISDGPLVAHELYSKKGIYPRPLVDNIHHNIPVWRDYVTLIAGGVRGTRANCEQLMQQNESILVYPGGTREICKRKGEEEQLIWKKRKGFARMAMKFGYPIVPVATLGGDELYEIIADSEEIMSTALGKILENSGFSQKYFKNGEHFPPLVKGIGLSWIPKPVRIYHYFGAPIETADYKADFENEAAQSEIREKVEKSMISMMNELKARRERESRNEPKWRSFLKNL